MRKFSGVFLPVLGAYEKTQECSISGIPKSAVLCSRKFRGLLEMVKVRWYKKYKHINCLKASSNCSM